jgi:hypothetical protein
MGSDGIAQVDPGMGWQRVVPPMPRIKYKEAEFLQELRPLSCVGLGDPFNQLTRSAGRM